MKFIVFCAAVAVVSASCFDERQCVDDSYRVVAENNGPVCSPFLSSVVTDSAPAVAAPLQISSPVVTSANAVSRNAIYKVALDNCGPRSKPLPPVDARPVSTAPIAAKPVVLPYKVPAPKTVSNRCKCEKVILKPQVVKQLVIVPVIRKYVQTLARPAYETINYSAIPVNCPKIETYCQCN